MATEAVCFVKIYSSASRWKWSMHVQCARGKAQFSHGLHDRSVISYVRDTIMHTLSTNFLTNKNVKQFNHAYRCIEQKKEILLSFGKWRVRNFVWLTPCKVCWRWHMTKKKTGQWWMRCRWYMDLSKTIKLAPTFIICTKKTNDWTRENATDKPGSKDYPSLEWNTFFNRNYIYCTSCIMYS